MVFCDRCALARSSKRWWFIKTLFLTFWMKLQLDYTCRARWPEGLLCWLSQFFKIHIVQILKHTFCTMCVLKSEHLEHGFAILHLVSVPQNVKVSRFDQKCTPARHTDGQTDGRTGTIHTSFSLTLSVVREHNSPLGKNSKVIRPDYFQRFSYWQWWPNFTFGRLMKTVIMYLLNSKKMKTLGDLLNILWVNISFCS